jgi:SAM-dependent methyltransferase
MAFCCPRCGQDIERHGDQISCASCGDVGDFRHEVPCFADPNYYWGELSLDEMRHANELAEETSWEQAVDRLVSGAELRAYIGDCERAAFQYLWNIRPESVVLDVGAGWGAIASGLAKNFARVVAVEGVLERCRFLRTRMKQMGHENVEVVCANFLELPLQRDQFDAVVLNGVLEWVGLGSRQGDPRDLQLAFLRRIHGLLKPGGIVYVGIENRIGFVMWRGARDHSGFRYTSLMPRRIANLWCRLQATGYRSEFNQGYRTYTYTLAGYRRLFREAGFPRIEPYHAWNGYNRPDVLLPLEGKTHVLEHFVSRLNLDQTARGKIKAFALKLAARSGLWRALASDYSFILEKN